MKNFYKMQLSFLREKFQKKNDVKILNKKFYAKALLKTRNICYINGEWH